MANTEDIALVVLSHGLWGVKGHMGFIEKKLIDKYGDKIHVASSRVKFDGMYLSGANDFFIFLHWQLNSSVNEAKFSYDGVDICGERLAEDVRLSW